MIIYKLKKDRNMGKYKWQGKPVKVEFGYCKVKTNKEKLLWWYNYECSVKAFDMALIPALKITYENQQFAISNHCGVGV